MRETILKIFSSDGNNEKWLEDEINKYAETNNLEFVSAAPCFRKGFIDSDYMFVTVVFKRKVGEQ